MVMNNYWRGREVLVTGADGFIGSHLCEQLCALGANVRALVLYNSRNQVGWLEDLTRNESLQSACNIVFGDIRDSERVTDLTDGIDTVFHLASLIAIPYSYLAPRSYVETNVIGALNILSACKLHNVARLVHTSTSEVYGSAKYVPIDEKHPLQGQSPYSASKIGADMLATSFFTTYDLPVSIARPFNTYGPRQSARAVIPTILSQLCAGRKTIQLGATSPTRDFNFVEDTVAGLLNVGECPELIGQECNIGSGKEISIGDLAELMIDIVGFRAEIIIDQSRLRPRSSEVTRLMADATKLRELTNWYPKYSLEAGLRVTAKWVEKNIDLFSPEKYSR